MKKTHEAKKTRKHATHKHNPPGTKIAKRVARHLGLPDKGAGVFHGGELTALNNERNSWWATRNLAAVSEALRDCWITGTGMVSKRLIALGARDDQPKR